jgi:glutamine synthetase
VLVSNVADKSITIDEAIDMASSILFHNSNNLYHLKLSPQSDFEDSPSVAGNPTSRTTSKVLSEVPTGTVREVIADNTPEAMRHTARDNAAQTTTEATGHITRDTAQEKQVSQSESSKEINSTSQRTDFIINPPRFVAIQWVDFLGLIRSQIVTSKQFREIIHGKSSLSVSLGNMGTLQDDTLTSFAITTGQIILDPVIQSGRWFPKDDGFPEMGSIISSFRAPTENFCPRFALNNLLYDLTQLYNAIPLLGFEIEFTLLRRCNTSIINSQQDQFVPIDDIHAWGTISGQQWRTTFPIITEIVEKLESCGIDVDKFHSESGYGQYEIALKPSEPLLAIDMLYQARQIITQTASKYDLHATFHPWPFQNHPRQFGSGAHAHISLNPKPGHKIPTWIITNFLTGVLDHLEAICAFTMPEGESYKRIRENSWTCGTYIAWGTQNREVPIRKSGPARYEIRCLDGFANMYLAISAIMAGGLLGIKAQREYIYKDCLDNPVNLTEVERNEYGINKKMPTTIYQSLEAISLHDSLKTRIGKPLVEAYIVMKREEQSHLTKMGPKAHNWLVERY